MLRFALFGFPIAIHWMFWVNSALMGGGLNASTPEDMRRTFTWVLASAISILIHELGHAFLMRRFGARASILLYTFGGLAIPEGRRFSRPQGIMVSLAGPIVQLALGFLVIWLTPGADLENYRSISMIFLHQLSYVSIWWAILNLAPIFPLDGGHVLRDVLGPQRFRITLQVSIVCALGLALLLLLLSSIFGAILFGLLAYENFRRLQGERPLSMLDPVP